MRKEEWSPRADTLWHMNDEGWARAKHVSQRGCPRKSTSEINLQDSRDFKVCWVLQVFKLFLIVFRDSLTGMFKFRSSMKLESNNRYYYL